MRNRVVRDRVLGADGGLLAGDVQLKLAFQMRQNGRPLATSHDASTDARSWTTESVRVARASRLEAVVPPRRLSREPGRYDGRLADWQIGGSVDRPS